jgi:predicted PurR-regulated permease PerM
MIILLISIFLLLLISSWIVIAQLGEILKELRKPKKINTTINNSISTHEFAEKLGEAMMDNWDELKKIIEGKSKK